MRSAVLTDDGLYRLLLFRCRDNRAPVLYVGMLNPSTADGNVDDHTIRKLYGFAKRLHCGSIMVWNLYAGRATKPRDLWAMDDPVGPLNDRYILRCLQSYDCSRDVFVLAWGANAGMARVTEVCGMIRQFHAIVPRCWGTTRDGQPRHPLMLNYETPLVPFAMPAFLH